MPRPRLQRRLCVQPKVEYFKPRGVPLRELKHVQLTREEVEAIWLVDLKGTEQIAAACHMHTSQSTIQRILVSARKKIAEAIMHGKAIAIIR